MEHFDKPYKGEGFKTPPNYFDTFEDRVMNRLSEMDSKHKVISPFYRKPLFWPIAACIALVFIAFGLYFNQNTTTVDLSLEFNQIDPIEVTEFINNNELNDEEFAEFVPSVTIDSIYNSDIVKVDYQFIDDEMLHELEDEYSILDETDI